MAIRSSIVAEEIQKLGLPWVLENPWRSDESAPSVFLLDEFAARGSKYKLFNVRVDQCMVGAGCEAHMVVGQHPRTRVLTRTLQSSSRMAALP